MSIHLKDIFDANRIEYRTSGPELSQGWIAFSCPWCSDAKTHMGYSERLGFFSCWRCGIKNEKQTLQKILGIPYSEVSKVIKRNWIPGSKEEARVYAKELLLPENSGKLVKAHRGYLKSRGFNPNELEVNWSLVSSLDEEYKDRILIPIWWKSKMVSYHSRDTTGKSTAKAKPCTREREVMSHKDILFGLERVYGNTVIVSEGPFDVFRWKCDAVCIWGLKCSKAQMDLLRLFKNIIIVFDGGKGEEIAQKRAAELADNLAIFQDCWVVDIGGDPADLSQKKADKIKKRLLKLGKEK